MADFAEFSFCEAAKYPFERIIWGCFFGKLVKLAQGHGHTHAHNATLDFPLLARWCAEAGQRVPHMEDCVTAGHALEMLLPLPHCRQVLSFLTQKAASVASTFAGRPIHIHLFHLNGTELMRI